VPAREPEVGEAGTVPVKAGDGVLARDSAALAALAEVALDGELLPPQPHSSVAIEKATHTAALALNIVISSSQSAAALAAVRDFTVRRSPIGEKYRSIADVWKLQSAAAGAAPPLGRRVNQISGITRITSQPEAWNRSSEDSR
jgi:hypothetical protein